MNILIVDDDPDFLEGLRRGLVERGHTVRAVDHPYLALEAFKAGQFDLIATDYNLPSMNGVDLLKTILTEHPETRRIIFSGAEEIDFSGKLEEKNVSLDAIFLKPFSISDLEAALARIKTEGV